ncbi:class I SAM-dependent methyltransferase [Niabella drilacis]|uniref:Methyltransferase domain-containing protein n=1 Tax=Niabella drilacis (strain DSM 25811 / CCM 8410 / CCUG 62505 / LMG 26954 / E90) TaxID=1285928 RepID=A0A1G6V3R1_NIADE|nr:class I SAM-dependent methyltransferase [Niabella drilacis]SDD48280.1 Methyltransferase domain-containing protein [Niabella drilacis]
MSQVHYEACPVCGSTQTRPVFLVKDYTVSGEVFPIEECISCSLRYTQNVPDQEAIGPYYKSEDYISHSNTSKGLVSRMYQRVRTRTMQQKAAIVERYSRKRAGKLLDVGCGTGTFLSTMKSRGWEVAGLEPDADARAMAKTLYNLVVAPSHEIYQLEGEQFDAITLWHVLEHVHELHGYMEQLKRMLKPGGVLLIAVPNYTSRDADIYEQYWAAYDVPRHLYHFSPDAMKVLTTQHGLRVIKLLPMWFDSFYVSLLSSRYKYGKTHYFGAGLHGLSSNINAAGNTKECSSVIYVIRKEQAI